MTNDWRIEVDAVDYLRNRQKELAFEQRRPAPRKAEDLGLGPGLGMSAVRLDDYNDILATFNGYYASVPGAAHAPTTTGRFVGFVTMDAEIGGVQVFTDIDSGTEYRRRFTRYPGDESVILWGAWSSKSSVPATAVDAEPGWPTDVPAGATLVALGAPSLDVNGEPGTYESSWKAASSQAGTTISLLKPGVYTGSVLVTGSTTVTATALEVTVPYKGSVRTRGVTFASMGSGGVRVPFTAIHTLPGAGLITVRLRHNNTGTQSFVWRDFQCARVGDAS